MKNHIFKLIAVCLFLSIAFSGCVKNEKGSSSQEGEQSLKIAVIPKGTTHEFWKAIHAGAIKAARELDVEILWKGSQKEDDRAQQITVVEDFVNRGVDGIVLAPLDDRALLRPVKDAVDEGIPVVIMDSALQGNDFISFVATDNYKGGVLAARAMGRLLPGGGKIFLIRYQEGSASTTKREQGFLDTIQKEFPEIEFLVQDLYAGASTETAFQFGENMLNRFPEVEGVFCPNESTTFGALRALQESRLAGKIVFIGFDSSPKLVQALREGHIQGLVLQNPMKIGYLGVKQIVFHLRGQTVPERVDTGVYLATSKNVDDPEIRSLLTPDFAKYLDR
jgi:ribose transport system substrate-binding protein